MTPKEFAHTTMLVASLRTRLAHFNALTAAVTTERDDIAKQLAAHVESLRLSNAQCGEYLRQNEQLHSELVDVRAALASTTEQRDSLRRTLDEWERADTKPHTRIDEVAQVVPVCMQCLKERIKTAHDYETGPSVAILTKPLLPDDVADHVVPPIMNPVSAAVADYQDLLKRTAESGMACNCSTHPHPPCSYCQPINDGSPEPDPANYPKDAKLEFRNVVPTPEMISACQWWDLVGSETAICFKNKDQRPVVWRYSVHLEPIEWQYTDCPQPLKPHGMTWQQLDKVLADKAQGTQAAPVPAAEVPLCNVCHGCGGMLIVDANSVGCYNVGCRRTMTVPFREATVSPFHPYHGPCATDGACSHG